MLKDIGNNNNYNINKNNNYDSKNKNNNNNNNLSSTARYNLNNYYIKFNDRFLHDDCNGYCRYGNCKKLKFIW